MYDSHNLYIQKYWNRTSSIHWTVPMIDTQIICVLCNHRANIFASTPIIIIHDLIWSLNTCNNAAGAYKSYPNSFGGRFKNNDDYETPTNTFGKVYSYWLRWSNAIIIKFILIQIELFRCCYIRFWNIMPTESPKSIWKSIGKGLKLKLNFRTSIQQPRFV